MFYEQEKYDLMIDWKKRLWREAPFFKRIFRQNNIRGVLDFGCGTGHHVSLFSSWGMEASGIDCSKEMIREARRKTGGKNFFVGSRARGMHDAITCLGNTLPHLFGAELRRVLSSFRHALKEEGLLIIQNLNYDRILEKRERIVGVGGDRKHCFLRFYDFGKRHIVFNMAEMRWEGKWRFNMESKRLNPIRKRELESTLGRARFGGMKFFGDYGGNPFTKESRDLVCVAKRKT